MAIPHFAVLSSASLVIPGTPVTLDIFASEPLAGAPIVKADNVRFATLQTQITPQVFRYSYTVSNLDTGIFYIKGTSLSTMTEAISVIPNVYALKFVGDPESPFGHYPFGYTYFGAGFPYSIILPPTTIDDPANAFRFIIRRGYEGPQVVTAWVNELGLTVKMLRKQLDYPLGDNDGEVVYQGIGSNYADLWVLDGKVYYYALFAELEPVTLPGIYTPVGRGHVLAIDNQGWVVFDDRSPVLSATTTAQPGTPSPGDRYLIPLGATGVDWAGQDDNIGTYDGAVWTFEVPKNLWTVLAQDTSDVWVFRDAKWTVVLAKDRLLLYTYLTDFDRDGDRNTNFRRLVRQADPDLDGEKFNFDLDQGQAYPELRRFLKLFELPLGEAKGLVDYFKQIYNVAEVDIDLLTRIGAAVGYDDFEYLGNPLRRFLIANMHAVWPRGGSQAIAQEAMPMWLGTGIQADLKRYRNVVFVANESEVPVLDPPPPGMIEQDTLADYSQRAMTFEWAGLFHHRGLGIWLRQPFDSLTWVMQGTALSRSDDQPVSPTTGALYIVPVGAVGVGWAGQDNNVALWNGVAWIFSIPTDRDAYAIADSGKTSVWVATSSEWRDAIDSIRLLMLEWWLREYALPGSVYFRFLENQE